MRAKKQYLSARTISREQLELVRGGGGAEAAAVPAPQREVFKLTPDKPEAGSENIKRVK